VTHLAAIGAFILAVVFYGWNVKHGVWSWEFFMLWGFLLEAVSGHGKWPWLPAGTARSAGTS